MAAAPVVLVATDLSARCDRAVDRAFMLARQLSGSVIVTHIAGASPLPQLKEDEIRQFIASDLGARPTEAQIVIGYGPVPGAIAQAARAHAADVTVTGVGHLNELRDYFLGTAVDYLVRQSPTPVLVVKQRALGPYDCIIAATDFSVCSQTAIEAAAALLPGARIRLVHAYQPSFEGLLNAKETAAFVREGCETEMNSFVQKLSADIRSRMEIHLEEGDLTRVLERKLRELPGSLLVIGSHGQSGISYAALGSRAAELLASEPSDILVVRPSH
jgi:nucleotide-binding universal stress UspA family protein